MERTKWKTACFIVKFKEHDYCCTKCQWKETFATKKRLRRRCPICSWGDNRYCRSMAFVETRRLAHKVDKDFEALAYALLKQHGLDDWSIQWFKHCRLLGLCCGGGKKVIKLSYTLEGYDLWQTFIHELAHALTPSCLGGVDKGHGAAWFKVAVMLGHYVPYSELECTYAYDRLQAAHQKVLAEQRAGVILDFLRIRSPRSTDELNSHLKLKRSSWKPVMNAVFVLQRRRQAKYTYGGNQVELIKGERREQ